MNQTEYSVALAGNPNVGKSTLFNALTGLRQHTGNWAGKTVANAVGSFCGNGRRYTLVDLPGMYSMTPSSAEEKEASDYIRSGAADAVAVVVDASSLERNLYLAMQIISAGRPTVVCVNLMDEAKKRGISVDLARLSRGLGVPAVGMSARSKKGIKDFVRALCDPKPPERTDFGDIAAAAESIARDCAVRTGPDRKTAFDRRLDRLLTSPLTGYPIMLALLAGVLWLTVTGANYPSELLQRCFNSIERLLPVTNFASEVLVYGLYRTVARVTAVMLPPMAIFFPLFTLLEDLGLLPRIAFNLDRPMCRAGAHGKMSLTMCMGLGCNACGVAGCRIIDSERERLVAILTNVFMPCNGRFPTMIVLITVFFGGGLLPAGLLTGLIIFAVLVTLGVSRLLTLTLLRGVPSAFVLELPPYRRPQIAKTLVRSLLDRTLFVLGRALTVAAPAGVIIYLLASSGLLAPAAAALEPFGRFIGLDGVTVAAFILGFPANEIVLPIAMTAYTASGGTEFVQSLDTVRGVLLANGWTVSTAVCALIFTLCHFPCGTTLLTVARETRSVKYTLLSFFLPLAVGIILCAAAKNIMLLF